MRVTDEMVLAGAREVCARWSKACGVDPEDNWKVYSDEHKEEARAILEAALAQQAGAVAKLSDVELRAVNGIIDAQEYEAGDVDDIPPSMDSDEDAYWAYHSYHGLMKLIASSGPGGGGEGG